MPTPAAVSRTVPVALFFVVGLLLTIVLEVINVYVRQEWSYATSMPTLGGIGLAPLLQRVALPPLTLWLARRHLGLQTRRPGETSADA
ncbi:MAG TPA: hypothetical protein VFU46_06100 [Gemmatimonadales bacterium]|nr:hypothetical protein [Gemmatimonadales bacterium]